ncbi:DUF4232 domain-containing protein [Micromonospora sp. NBC_01813]|uniref:DUF4232 domain-containing protein n=1 Tax=Micromonospora sp. NBC_01813 TaxID=2975988 RepID=UPI002DDAD25C|nr:DUF4232 domain-containing protein [Micromonospora sp. NBC_01813]WSA06232.1 DUF4232 domain-containing protein [Micromonospora sp. NBC_01813]
MKPRLMALVATALVTALLAGCAGQVPQPGPQPPSAAPLVRTIEPLPSSATDEAAPDCPASGLALSLGAADAAMGLRAMPIFMVNCADRPYPVFGYPELSLLGEEQEALEVEVLAGVSAVALIEQLADDPQPVTLAPGARAAAVLVWRNTVADVTPPVLGTYLRVVPVPGTAAQVLLPDGGVDVGTTGRVAVSPWAAAR